MFAHFFKFPLLAALIAGTALLNGCTVAPTRGAVQVHSDNVSLKLAFNDYDRNYIHRYYGYPHKHRKPLPPGYYNRFHRHKPLPRNYYPRPLPWELERRLSPLPSGYMRMIIGNDVVLMNSHNRVVYDILWSIR
ncbi:hypothetical protein [Thiomicrorhabdus cannonii]|uniref:hypothetical protein n=1 Tax=Thiomicrorhabdus cannonii TaxID=2748011 RepID=UPI0015BC0799|nr:hypothetical protein [Thiomicrorhabdus cannonii]